MTKPNRERLLQALSLFIVPQRSNCELTLKDVVRVFHRADFSSREVAALIKEAHVASCRMVYTLDGYVDVEKFDFLVAVENLRGDYEREIAEAETNYNEWRAEFDARNAQNADLLLPVEPFPKGVS